MLSSIHLSAQVLHTENFNVILDTTQVLKGEFNPFLRYRNLKNDLIELENISDLSFRLKNHGLTLANKIEYSVFGKEKILSGGFVYIEYVNIHYKRKIEYEPNIQIHWHNPRGMENKYAGGINFRIRFLSDNTTGMYSGLGVLYEFERWNYSGVAEELQPVNPQTIEVKRSRANMYFSFKKDIIKPKIGVDVSVYYQPFLGAPLNSYRLAGSFEIVFKLTNHVGFRILYQNIYDSRPIVPIDKLFHDYRTSLSISF